jgi:uncharacterized cupredoxin-like copper-binding protein
MVGSELCSDPSAQSRELETHRKRETMARANRIQRAATVAAAVLAIGVGSFHHGIKAEASGSRQTHTLAVRVVLRDFTISMSTHRIPAGTPIRFVITNRGQATHETVLERAGADDKALEVRGKEYEADDIAPGTTRVVTWTIPQAGKYQLACHMPGHFEMGMKTLFTARGR